MDNHSSRSHEHCNYTFLFAIKTNINITKVYVLSYSDKYFGLSLFPEEFLINFYFVIDIQDYACMVTNVDVVMYILPSCVEKEARKHIKYKYDCKVLLIVLEMEKGSPVVICTFCRW